MPSVHLIYPHGDRISCPDAIGRRLARALGEYYTVHLHDWDDTSCISPELGDILLGHPHPAPWTIYRRSMRHTNWSRRIAMFPYSHGDRHQAVFAESSVHNSDQALLIAGRYWADSIANSHFSHWLPKVRFLDLAVDRRDFPRIKSRFNEPGKRRLIYIGNSSKVKNPNYLSQIASMLPHGFVSWAGSGSPIPHVRSLGYVDFSTREARDLVAAHDFLISVSHSDANPAAILEAMSWGLLPICTPQSGYKAAAGIVNIPLNEPERALSTIQRLLYATEGELQSLRAENDCALESDFTWPRFIDQVLASIMEPLPLSRACRVPRRARVEMALRYSTSHFSPARPGNLRLLARAVRRSLHGVHVPARDA